jgi:hypothetical protein
MALPNNTTSIVDLYDVAYPNTHDLGYHNQPLEPWQGNRKMRRAKAAIARKSK